MERVYIIAEAGVNHNGSLDTAKRLAEAAKAAGADAVKYQTFCPEKLAAETAPQAAYQKDNMGDTGGQLAMLRRLALSEAEFRALKAHCDAIGITFLSTAFDRDSLELLLELGVPVLKVPSGEITNLPLLQQMAATGKPLLVSTGMCDMDEVAAAMGALRDAGAGDICLLHCTTQYPTPPEQVNLRAMDTLASAFGVPVGYSDHTRGTDIPVAAVAMGARVIEKHFTLDRCMEGPDHKASLQPEELTDMVTAIRRVEQALGDGVKRPCAAELPNRAVARKSLVAACAIHKGDLFTEKNITAKRPGNGISPMLYGRLLGQVAQRDYRPDEPIDREQAT